MSAPDRSIVIFDLGGVLVDWNPRYVYRKLFGGDEAAMETFLSTVCTPHWNEQQDAGRSFAEATAELKAKFPSHGDLIDAWPARFDDMMSGAIQGTVDILEALDAKGVPLYALSNWSAETFPIAERRFGFLQRFRGRVISGQEGLIKPDPRIYRLLLDRYGIDPHQAVYIDDNARNAAASTEFGIHGIHFTDPAALRVALVELGLL